MFKNTSLNIKVVDDIYPYKQRKVAILNGAHTALVPLAYMAGIEAVGEAMDDKLFTQYVEKLMFDEIIPTLNLPKDELVQFANDVIKRFRNPYIHHLLLSISLNSMTKFHTRILPQLLTFVEKHQQVPTLMAQAIAAQILMYRGTRDGQAIELSDSPQWMALFADVWQQHSEGTMTTQQVVESVLGASWHWEQNLNDVEGLTLAVTSSLAAFLNSGVRVELMRTLQA
ncbi:hypothetical protein [Psychrosphaera algicola]|uniref:Mannitol dehydrogenase C-terminal domain-containing protein n=1 Tax=Psychrosphaera algicola TaxID=3023714 RepID=A0ABT5FIE3_9GAMM|nr:hypothetical protein [Psychrosphaera sp. G1-22]MDC2890968.1 hypothetical protein [Psychrosphaera sp. G1-22]